MTSAANLRRPTVHVLRWTTAMVLAAAAAGLPARGSSIFLGVGDLSGGSVGSDALGVSADGTTVVGSSASSKSSSHAYRWTNGTIAALPIPGGSWLTRAHASSSNGQVIVGRLIGTESDNGEAVVWENGHLTHLGYLGGAPAFDSEAMAVTPDGTRIAGRSTNGAGGIEAFIRPWPDGSMTGLGNAPGVNYGSSLGISSNGRFMAGFVIGDFNQAARFEPDGTTTTLEDLPGGNEYGIALGISADGSTIIGQSQSAAGTEAVRWTSDLQIHSLGALEAGQPYSTAWGVSGNGSVIVGSASGTGNGAAFYWDAEHGFRLLADVLTNDYGLDVAGWNLVEAHGVSADGRVIVGDGINPSGNTEGWIAILDNAPRLSVSRTQVSWIQPLHPNGTRWDVVRGGLATLRGSGGDFSLSTLGCVANNTSSMTVSFTPSPAAGDGFWFLVREGAGSYDENDGHQVGSRDAGIAASGHGCP